MIVRPIPEIAFRQCGTFTSEQARRDGWTRSALSHARRIGRVEQLRVGAYQVSDLGDLDPWEAARWRHAGPAIAAALLTPGSFVSHSGAAVLRGLPLLFLPSRCCISVVPWHTGEIARVHIHRTKAAPLALPVGGVPCASVERTGIDLAREHGVVSGVVAMDAMLHRRLTNLDSLHTALARCSRWPGIRAAREAVAQADPASESPLETRSRLKFSEFGVPAPRLQVRIGDIAGRFIGRVDFYWDDFGVVGEADGAIKYDDEQPMTLAKEKLRQESLERTNLIVVRWGSADLQAFDDVAERIRRAFQRGRRRPAAERRWTVLPDLDPAAHARGAAQRA